MQCCDPMTPCGEARECRKTKFSFCHCQAAMNHHAKGAKPYMWPRAKEDFWREKSRVEATAYECRTQSRMKARAASLCSVLLVLAGTHTQLTLALLICVRTAWSVWEWGLCLQEYGRTHGSILCVLLSLAYQAAKPALSSLWAGQSVFCRIGRPKNGGKSSPFLGGETGIEKGKEGI